MKSIKAFSKILVIIGITASLLSGCGNSSALERHQNISFDAFDTAITFVAYTKTEEEFNALAEEVNSEFIRYHRLFDIYNSYGDLHNIRTINDNAGKEAVEVDPEIIDMLKFAKDLYFETDGKVNIAMGAVLKLWHQARTYSLHHPDEAVLPDYDRLVEASKHCDINDLVIDEENNTVFLKDSAMSLDVGATAKGYAVEKIGQMLEQRGLTNIVINAGGNVKALGSKPGGEAWAVGIQNPDLNAEQKTITTLDLSDISVVTSGVYERNFVYEGRTYHHIIDGDTLYPENRYLAVSIITKDSALADALSTAVFNMDYDEAQAFVSAHPELEVLYIFNDGTWTVQNR